MCMCEAGWHGTDCARPRAGTAAAEALAGGGAKLGSRELGPREQKRPLIYVYDMPVDFNTRILQKRSEP